MVGVGEKQKEGAASPVFPFNCILHRMTPRMGKVGTWSFKYCHECLYVLLMCPICQALPAEPPALLDLCAQDPEYHEAGYRQAERTRRPLGCLEAHLSFPDLPKLGVSSSTNVLNIRASAGISADFSRWWPTVFPKRLHYGPVLRLWE